jgi:hypothetical protein
LLNLKFGGYYLTNGGPAAVKNKEAATASVSDQREENEKDHE